MINTGPNRSQLVQQMLQQQSARRPRQIGSWGEGLARVGTDIVDAMTQKKLIDERMAGQEQQQADMLKAFEDAGLGQYAGLAASGEAGLVGALMNRDARKNAPQPEKMIQLSGADAVARGYPEGSVVEINPNTGAAKIVSQPKGPLVQVDTGDKSRGKGFEEAEKKAATAIEIQGEKAMEAERQLNTLAAFETNLNTLGDGPLTTGAFGEFRKGLGQTLAAVGLVDDAFLKTLATAEDTVAIGNRLQLAEGANMKGPPSEKEQVLMKNANANFGNTPLGNRFIIARVRSAQRKEQLFNDVLNDNLSLMRTDTDYSREEALRDARKTFQNIPHVSEEINPLTGMPLFFTEFYDTMKQANPNMTLTDTVALWKRGK